MCDDAASLCSSSNSRPYLLFQFEKFRPLSSTKILFLWIVSSNYKWDKWCLVLIGSRKPSESFLSLSMSADVSDKRLSLKWRKMFLLWSSILKLGITVNLTQLSSIISLIACSLLRKLCNLIQLHQGSRVEGIGFVFN